jgi:hypothetical protein
MITILVGDVTEYLSIEAFKIDKSATLITEQNFTNLPHGTYYTSLGDFSTLKNFVDTLDQADTIVYCPPVVWSDYSAINDSYMKKYTIFYCIFFKDKKHVKNIDNVNNNILLISDLVDKRRSNKPQIWSIGCSVTHGDFMEKSKRYGQLVSDHFNLPISFLTLGGSSIEWAADQILRSDIKKNDVIIWGITSADRLMHYRDHKVEHIRPDNLSRYPLFNHILFDTEFNKFKALTRIHQVVNFSNKIGSHLFLANILGSSMTEELSNLPNYTQLFGFFGFNADNMYLDFADDERHPGPLTHRWYADQLIKKIEKLFKP